jgi:hypothetical protein
MFLPLLPFESVLLLELVDDVLGERREELQQRPGAVTVDLDDLHPQQRQYVLLRHHLRRLRQFERFVRRIAQFRDDLPQRRLARHVDELLVFVIAEVVDGLGKRDTGEEVTLERDEVDQSTADDVVDASRQLGMHSRSGDVAVAVDALHENAVGEEGHGLAARKVTDDQRFGGSSPAAGVLLHLHLRFVVVVDEDQLSTAKLESSKVISVNNHRWTIYLQLRAGATYLHHIVCAT